MLRCKITGEEIDEAGGWYGYKDLVLSDEGVEYLLRQYLDKNRNRFGVTLFVHNLYFYFCEKKKRVDDVSKQTRKFVLEKYKHTCAYCGSNKNLEIDHIHPVSKGGKSLIPNLQVLCKTCNCKKGNKIHG